MAKRERLDGDEPKRNERVRPDPQPEIVPEPEDNDAEVEETPSDGDLLPEEPDERGQPDDTPVDPYAYREADEYWDRELEDDEWVLYEGKLLPPDIAQYVKKVNDTHDQATQKIIETGLALIEMKGAIKDREWIRTFESSAIHFSIRTADKYMAIARNAAISQNSAKMPGSPDALEFIAHIRAEVVEEMADKGIINPSMTIEQARNLPAVTLPKVLDALSEITVRDDAAATAELIAQHLWWLYVRKRDGGGGAARTLLTESAAWLATFSETYKRCEEQHRSDWLEQSDNEIEQLEINKKEKKIKAALRKRGGGSRFRPPKKRR